MYLNFLQCVVSQKGIVVTVTKQRRSAPAPPLIRNVQSMMRSPVNLQAEQTKGLQPLIKRLALYTLYNLCHPSLDTLSQVYALFVVPKTAYHPQSEVTLVCCGVGKHNCKHKHLCCIMTVTVTTNKMMCTNAIKNAVSFYSGCRIKFPLQFHFLKVYPKYLTMKYHWF